MVEANLCRLYPGLTPFSVRRERFHDAVNLYIRTIRHESQLQMAKANNGVKLPEGSFVRGKTLYVRHRMTIGFNQGAYPPSQKRGEDMAEENVTTKFKVDISDLKKNITEANRQVKLYKAELTNASAGMQKGEETADSLTKKIEAQSQIVEAEKAKLQALKDELTRYEANLAKGESTIADLTRKHEEAAAAFGKDSTEAKALAKQLKEAQAAQERNAKAADELRVRIVNQDTAVKNAEGQVKQFRTALDDLQKEEKETGDEAEKISNGALEELITKAYGAESAMKAQYASMLAGKNGLSEFLAIVNASDEDFDKLTDSIYHSEGAAKSMADTMNDNLEGSLTLLSSAFDGFKKAIYDKISAQLNDLVKQITANIMPALTGIIEGTPGAADKLADGISNLFSNALKTASKLLPRAVDALGAVLGALGDAIVRQAPAATDAAVSLLERILDGILHAIPKMVKGLTRIVKVVASGLGELLTHLADSIVDAIPGMMQSLMDALPHCGINTSSNGTQDGEVYNSSHLEKRNLGQHR